MSCIKEKLPRLKISISYGEADENRLVCVIPYPSDSTLLFAGSHVESYFPSLCVPADGSYEWEKKENKPLIKKNLVMRRFDDFAPTFELVGTVPRRNGLT